MQLSVTELATVEQRDARAAESEASKLARRSDYYALKREEIQKSVGVTPASGGSFICRKCKKERTSFYQMQTRSSDEPMTVFINCLDCGFRWRE
jgi:transcription elongation factor S-II